MRFGKLKQRVKRPLQHVKKVKHVRWLIPGWIFYEFYRLHKKKGYSRKTSFGHGIKAEAIRIATTASLPLPGTYELTTTGLAFLKKKIENNEIEKLTLKAFKDFTPLKIIRRKKMVGKPYLRILLKDRRLYFKIFYRKK